MPRRRYNMASHLKVCNGGGLRTFAAQLTQVSYGAEHVAAPARGLPCCGMYECR